MIWMLVDWRRLPLRPTASVWYAGLRAKLAGRVAPQNGSSTQCLPWLFGKKAGASHVSPAIKGSLRQPVSPEEGAFSSL